MAAYPTPPCPMCGVWDCLDCGTRTSGRSRYYPGRHHCRACKSTNGRMLAVHHRPDIYDSHASDVDPQAICHYPLDGNEPTTQQIPGHVRPAGRNAMNTKTPVPAAGNRVTAPINGVFDLDASAWDELPELRAALGTVGVQWSLNDDGKIETEVSLTINGTVGVASFWNTDSDGVLNTAEDTFGSDDDPIWEDLEPEDFEAVVEWGKQVHSRICAGAEYLISQAASPGSDAYKAIIAYATGVSVKVPVFDVHELGEDGDRWLVLGTTEETSPSLIKTDVGKWLVETLGVEYDSLPDLIRDLKEAKLTFRDNWALEPVDPGHPDEDSLLKHGDEADHALPRFAATLVTI